MAHRIRHGYLQCFALERLAAFHVKAQAVQIGGAGADGGVEHVAELREVIDPHLDGVARHIATRRLLAVGVVVFHLQVDGKRTLGTLGT